MVVVVVRAENSFCHSKGSLLKMSFQFKNDCLASLWILVNSVPNKALKIIFFLSFVFTFFWKIRLVIFNTLFRKNYIPHYILVIVLPLNLRIPISSCHWLKKLIFQSGVSIMQKWGTLSSIVKNPKSRVRIVFCWKTELNWVSLKIQLVLFRDSWIRQASFHLVNTDIPWKVFSGGFRPPQQSKYCNKVNHECLFPSAYKMFVSSVYTLLWSIFYGNI